jgi:hypothetical protein
VAGRRGQAQCALDGLHVRKPHEVVAAFGRQALPQLTDVEELLPNTSKIGLQASIWAASITTVWMMSLRSPCPFLSEVSSP